MDFNRQLGVTYISTHLPEHIKSDMRHIKEIGCTEVLFALQENHTRTLTGALKYGARIAKDSGLKPYTVIWGYANTFGGGRMSLIMLENLDMWMIDKDGNLLPLACLNNTKIVDKFIEIAGICMKNGFEGIFIDEPTYQECFCKQCQKIFSNTFSKSLKESTGTEEYKIFRNNTVINYIKMVCKRIKELNPDFRTITCLMPTEQNLFKTVASIPELDVFGTDPYWLLSNGKMTISDACNYAKAVKEICLENKKISQIWLNCWCIPKGLEEEVYKGGKKLAQVGCDSFYTWGFKGALGTLEECDNPQEAWNNVIKLYKELSQEQGEYNL